MMAFRLTMNWDNYFPYSLFGVLLTCMDKISVRLDCCMICKNNANLRNFRIDHGTVRITPDCS